MASKNSVNDAVKAGQNIGRIRQKLGLSQESLAEKSHVSRSQIQRLENGNCGNVGIATIAKLATALNVSAEEILGLKEEN